MQFAWFQKKYESTDVSAIIHNDGRQVVNLTDTLVAFRQTYGLIANHNTPDFSFGGELFYQGGKNGSNTDLSALLVSAYFTYKTDLTPVTLAIDYLSGTSIEDTKDKSFDPLYGTNHKFYGFMDYFYVGNFHGQAATSSGLTDIQVKTNWKLGEITSLTGNLHFFTSPANLFDPNDINTSISGYLGTELDVVFVAKLAKNVRVDVGYSQMFATSSMEAIKSTPGDHTALNNWAWLQVNFNPTLITHSFKKE